VTKVGKILVLVEGQTEETFVRDVLAPHLALCSKSIVATLVVTKKMKSGPSFKGGVLSYRQVKRDLTRLLGDSSVAQITTMLDYYALPNDFPGCSSGGSSPPGVRVAQLEEAFRVDIADRRFVPYLSQHEFEALLFADPESARELYDDPATVDAMLAVRAEFGGNPELINSGPMTAPSKRMKALFDGYQKTVHGPLAAHAAGVHALRSNCPHFDQWLRALET
jgi:hypothetical protein